MKKQYLLLFLLLYCLCSCSSENETKNRTRTGEAITINLDLFVPEGELTKAGIIGADDKPPKDVNITQLYLVTSTNDILPLDVISDETGGKKVVLTFIHDAYESETNENDYYDHVIIKNSKGEQVVLNCTDDAIVPVYFSSIPTSAIQMEPSTVRTPNGKLTYNPIGDKLFRTQLIDVTVTYPRKGDPYIQWGGTKVDDTMTITVELNRSTGILSCRLVVVGDNELETGDEYFISATGTSPAEWSARFFLMDFPLMYDINNNVVSGGLLVGNVVSNSEKVIVALSDNWLGFADKQGATVTEGTNMTMYRGWGCVDNSYPYIYHESLVSYWVYISIKDPNGKINTLRMKPNSVLNANHHLRGNVVIHVDDLANAFKSSPVMKSFGNNIIDIPYKLSFEEID